MIKLEIADVGQLTEREATALGHMFMHLAGHSLHVAPEPKPMTDFEGPEEDNPDNYPLTPSLDSTGIRWDSRIHARNRSKTPSGVWKLGRNVAPELVKQVMAELKGEVMPMPISDIPAPMPIMPLPAPSPTPLPLVQDTFIPPPAPMPIMSLPAPIPMVTASGLYESLLNKVTSGMGAGTLTIAAVNNVLRSFKDVNVANLAALGTFSDTDKLMLIPRIIAELDKVTT